MCSLVTLHIFKLPFHRNIFDLPLWDYFHNYKVNTTFTVDEIMYLSISHELGKNIPLH